MPRRKKNKESKQKKTFSEKQKGKLNKGSLKNISGGAGVQDIFLDSVNQNPTK
jgi:hypothetical protein